MLERRRLNASVPTAKQTAVILEKYQATEGRLLELKAALAKDHCPVQTLEIRQNQMNDQKTKMLCDALRLNSSLTKIVIVRCRLRTGQLT